MGRRALPKIDPLVDFAPFFREMADVEVPFDPQSLFPKPRPLHIEVGSGKGHFLLTESERRPNDNFLGLEIAKKYARFAASRAAKHGRTNVQVICGDAVRIVSEWIPTASTQSVHVYFPDPWWKERHRKRRVVRAQLVAAIERVLVPGGLLHFWTDVAEYFQTGTETILSNSNLTGPLPVEVDEDDANNFRTHFERRMKLLQKDVFRAVFSKPKL